MANKIVTGPAFATELRKLADAVEPLERVSGEFGKPWLFISFKYGGAPSKDAFIELAKVLPKPYMKKPNDQELILEYVSEGMDVRASIERSQVCELVEPARPAVYRCEPLLSDDEDAEITGLDPIPAPVVEDAVVEAISLGDIAASTFAEEVGEGAGPLTPEELDRIVETETGPEPLEATPEQQQELAESFAPFAPLEQAELDETLDGGEPLEPLEPLTADQAEAEAQAAETAEAAQAATTPVLVDC